MTSMIEGIQWRWDRKGFPEIALRSAIAEFERRFKQAPNCVEVHPGQPIATDLQIVESPKILPHTLRVGVLE